MRSIVTRRVDGRCVSSSSGRKCARADYIELHPAQPIPKQSIPESSPSNRRTRQRNEMANRSRIPRRILEEAAAQRRNAIIRAVIARPQRTLLSRQRSRRDVLSRKEIPPSLLTRLQLLPRCTSRSIHTRARFKRSHRRA